MRRFIIIILVMCSVLIMVSCDGTAGRKPLDLNNIKWVSQDPDIWFVVQDGGCWGELSLDGEVIGIEVWFAPGTGIDFVHEYTDSGYDIIIRGSWKNYIRGKTFTFEIYENTGSILGDDIKEIVFTREEYDTGKRWYDDVGSKWVSDDPDIWFVVASPIKAENRLPLRIHSVGEMNINGEIIKIIAEAASGSRGIEFYPYAEDIQRRFFEDRFFRVSCRYGVDEFYAHVIVSKHDPQFFEEEHTVITFRKVNAE